MQRYSAPIAPTTAAIAGSGQARRVVTLRWKAFPGFSIADHQHRWRSMRQVTARRRSEIDDVASLWIGDGLESRQADRT
jgi:hypothetical protein